MKRIPVPRPQSILSFFILPVVASLLLPATDATLSAQETVLVNSTIVSPDTSRQILNAMIDEHIRKGDKPNRLINEKSPYLLQHAFNPVDWYPWGEEAFARAREEDKPIFLSIGYSTCYWCHVMEREVFENAEIAELMNDQLICIKVDREERPDIDRLYMTAVQALTGSGGWPMSVFLTPDLKPFFGGTYFPPTPQQGRPSFPQIVERITEIWRNDDRRLRESAEQVLSHLTTYAAFTAGTVEADSVISRAYVEIAESFDSIYAGFGGAPKFPRPSLFSFLFRYHARTNDSHALAMALQTLRAMASGGMYDQIGGGFHRYSVDEQWRVPHFEKMLYDQAQLATASIEAYQISGDQSYADLARDILAYVSRDMTDPAGGFYSAEDAESAADASRPSEKEEGTFYLWSRPEIARYLGEQDAAITSEYFGIEEKGNALADPLGVFEGKNIPYRARTPDEMAQRHGMTPGALAQLLATSRIKLFEARELRPKPFRDEKILTAWNGLMITAYARAFQALRDTSYRNAARKGAEFLLLRLRDPGTGMLSRRYFDGEARFAGTLQDYAFLTQALLDLYECDFDVRWLDEAIGLTTKQIALFWNAEGGGFFDAPPEESSLLLRMREDYDGAEPTGNSIAALNLLRLGRITDNKDWMAKAQATIESFATRLNSRPDILPQLLVALDALSGSRREIIVAGDPGSQEFGDLLALLQKRFIPNTILLAADGQIGQRRLASFLPFISDMRMTGTRPTFYFCEKFACQLPTDDPAIIEERIRNMATAPR